MKIKKKLRTLFEKSENLYELDHSELEKITITEIFIVDSEEKFTIHKQANGYNNMAILIYDREQDKYYSNYPQFKSDVLLICNCDLNFAHIDVPTDLGCVRFCGFGTDGLGLRAAGDSIIIARKGGKKND